MRLTGRDTEILECLCCRVRMFSLNQLAETWWQDAQRAVESARKRLASLIRSELLAKAAVIAAPLPEISGPVVRWAPGHSTPDMGAAAWRIQSRWVSPPQPMQAYLATAQAARHFGGRATGRLKHQYQATHDFGVAEMYLQIRKHRPELIPHWIGEDLLAPHRKRQKLPDAILAESPGAKPMLVLEFGGSYDKARLIDFHRDCERRALPYEVW